MSVNGINRLQAAKMQANAGRREAAMDSAEGAIDKIEAEAKQAYAHKMEAVEAAADARDTMSTWQLIGNVLGALSAGNIAGQVLGGAVVGRGVGEAANNGDEQAAQKADELVGVADLAAEGAGDALDDAKDVIRDTKQSDGDVIEFGAKLRRMRWVGLV